MATDDLLRAALPLGVDLGFALHWLTVARIRTAEERLPHCRGAYLAFSLQLLIYAWAVFLPHTTNRTAATLVPLGMTFSFLGDFFNLQFPFVRNRFPEPVLFGILSFAFAQLLYTAGFLSLVPVRELLRGGFLLPLLLLFLAVPAIVFRLRVFSRERPRAMMRAAFLYGFALGAMVAVALSAAVVRGGCWYCVGSGSLFFLASDAVMGSTTLHGRHPSFEYQVPWGTYLVAQGLMLFGASSVLAA